MELALIRLIAQSACLASALWGCGNNPENQRAAGATTSAQAQAQAPTQAEPTLYGRWRITGINGSAPLKFDRTDASRAYLTFSQATYGGSTGCNSFGGTGLLVGRRWFGEPPMATQQGCAHLTAQEQAIMSIVSSGPAIAFQGPAEATLATALGSLRLRREAAPDVEAVEPAPMLLAGTAWEVRSIDGRPVGELSRRERARLSFDADRWKLDAGCSPLTGPWRQVGRAVTMELSSKQPSGCSPTLKAEDDAIRAMFRATPQYVVGHNREIVLGGGDHWLTGSFDPTLARKASDSLRGEWRVDAVDGVAPKAMPRPPSLTFGKSYYGVWDGCNHTEGIMLVVAGQLFTRGSGMSTLANCMPDPMRGRVPAIIGSNPRIAKTQSGGMALVAPSGTLRLTRLSSRTFGTHEDLGLRGPRRIALLSPSASLALHSGGKFTVELQCGKIQGEWRGGQPARFSPDPLERTASDCDRSPASEAFRMSQFFTGDILSATGPNRDIVLLVNEDRSIAGRVAD
jgi:heat shock protein HslJ